MKYRKKPVVIEAIQYTGENGVEVDRWMQERGVHNTEPTWRGAIPIQTLEGTVTASVGDWIICGVNGELYPCKPDIFAKTYDAAEEPAKPHPRGIIRVWRPGMSDAEAKDLAYWERNVLALRFAQGWYNDDVEQMFDYPNGQRPHKLPRYPGWRRVLSLEGGGITFHIPDNFDVGTLPEIAPNWDGHSTEQKWLRILRQRGVM